MASPTGLPGSEVGHFTLFLPRASLITLAETFVTSFLGKNRDPQEQLWLCCIGDYLEGTSGALAQSAPGSVATADVEQLCCPPASPELHSSCAEWRAEGTWRGPCVWAQELW